ncbi:hypothetical protein FRY74_08495 [Vicingus serpentipes]|jgi:hypothetical protein|uniref:Uncharacterized protein n=1 Tax=Vicingus serpentipes TaxID=1926625 RepID=A0A5C6RVS3_9FLAO|nr:hypothetical protein [Vicingus serpentipes]TXB65452.1 hypothetical protein FRY74_08495 [Vicingus serpentipes]
MNSNNIFPIFRKYKNEKSFFKIISKTEFEEVKLLKDKAEIHHFTANILPDFNFISDMISDFEPYWEISSEKEFETIKSKI